MAHTAELDPRKEQLRRAWRERRAALDPQHVAWAGHAVAARVAGLSEFRTAVRVALYAALPDEVPTRAIFEALTVEGRERLLPRIEGRALVFARVKRWEDLRPGRYGLGEPQPEAPTVRLVRGDLLLVPGVAFDEQGGRLGRGGGYYDRALGELSGSGVCVVGLAFEEQIVACVPRAAHDRGVHAIVTEAQVRHVAVDGEPPR